jgi:alpha-D-ribose 1-methylphosphonate 5-triphosphate synthase subunit PhnI
MYVAVKGGEEAIRRAHALLARERRGDPDVPELTVEQIAEQLRLAVDRVMTEGSLYDPELAALAIKQARGDLIEAIFLLRAYRTTLPRLAVSLPIETARMVLLRRISATFKDLPGGQILGPTFDYTHRLLDFSLASVSTEKQPEAHPAPPCNDEPPEVCGVVDLLNTEGLIEPSDQDHDGDEVPDLTRQPLEFPVSPSVRRQNLARGDEGFLLALAYSTQRGYGNTHAFAGEIRVGEVSVEILPAELGFAIDIGDIAITECQMISQFQGSSTQPPRFTRGYGLTFGYCERKAMSMAIVDRALRSRELGEEGGEPAQDEEFVLSHSDNVQATGFVEHLKLPHYVDFQAELESVRRMRGNAQAPGDIPAQPRHAEETD